MPWKETKPASLSASPICCIFLKRYKDKEEIIMDPSKYCLLREEHTNGDKEYYAIYIQTKYIQSIKYITHVSRDIIILSI